MPDSTVAKNPKAQEEVEVIEQTQKSKQDITNNNKFESQPLPQNQGQSLLYPRPSSDLLRPPAAPGFGLFPPPRPLNFPSTSPWLYRGLFQPAIPAYPIGRGHELMRRLCTMNPAFAQSIIEDYIRPQVKLKYIFKSIEFKKQFFFRFEMMMWCLKLNVAPTQP